MKEKLVWLISVVILGLIGLFMLGSAWYSSKETQQFLQAAVSESGKVIDLKVETGKDRAGRVRVSYYPVIEFVTQNQQKITFTSSVSVDKYKYPVNEQVGVLYLKTNPQDAKLDSFDSLWSLTIVFSVIGLAFCCASLFVHWAKCRDKQPSQMLLGAAIFGVAAMFLYLGAWWTSLDSLYLVKNGLRTSGTIIVDSAAPVVEFKTWGGKIMQYQSNVSSNPPAYSQGEKVSILYDASNPKLASIDSFMELWLSGAIMAGMATLFLLICLAGFYLERRGNQQGFLSKRT